MNENIKSFVFIGVCISFFLPVFAECPSADLTGDCRVNLADLAMLAGEWLTGRGVPADMALIPGGTFMMGNSFSEGTVDELPVHSVTLSPFYMGKFAVTNAQYAEFLNSALSQRLIRVTDGIVYPAGSETSYPYCDTTTSDSWSQIIHWILFSPVPPYKIIDQGFRVNTKLGRSMASDPMICVSWYGAAAYCNWRSEKEGRELCYDLSAWVCDFNKKGYRLPTEAQWEYAARGGLAGKRFPWGDTITHSQANYRSMGSFSYDISPTEEFHPTWDDGIMPFTAPVDTFGANNYGLYSMAGNVWQFCNDWFLDTYYSSSPVTNPTGPVTGSKRVIRGGTWGTWTSWCRVADRGIGGSPPDSSDYLMGFRLSLDIE